MFDTEKKIRKDYIDPNKIDYNKISGKIEFKSILSYCDRAVSLIKRYNKDHMEYDLIKRTYQVILELEKWEDEEIYVTVTKIKKEKEIYFTLCFDLKDENGQKLKKVIIDLSTHPAMKNIYEQYCPKN